MTQTYKPTQKQREATQLFTGPAKHIMCFGGSRSGKTFLIVRAVMARAIKAPMSRHAILRQRFNHVIQSIGMDTLPKVARLCFPDMPYKLDKQHWIVRLPNESEVWLGGLDDKERTEKVLGQEHASIFLNECSQIGWDARNYALTRLAQAARDSISDRELALRMYYDCNPPSKAHWAYRLFIENLDPETKRPIPDPDDYVSIQMNPGDNAQNLPASYLQTLQNMPARMRRRFFDGVFADATPNALFPDEILDKWRHDTGELPDWQRIGIAIDPSGAGDEDNAENDEIGIAVGALGVDGNAYLLEDLTLKAGPATWAKVATGAFERHNADFICGEVNFGGAMVEHTVQTARPNTPFRQVRASRGKVVRAEPISALMEQGKIRLAGNFPELEDELQGFSTTGYTGQGSPNRADAFVWLMTEFFPGIVNEKPKWQPLEYESRGIV